MVSGLDISSIDSEDLLAWLRDIDELSSCDPETDPPRQRSLAVSLPGFPRWFVHALRERERR